jgi:hypothetical protein
MSKPMSDERIYFVKDQLETITQGPWDWYETGHRGVERMVEAPPAPDDSVDVKGLCVASMVYSPEDAQFIADAPDLVRDLIAEIERLKAELEGKPQVEDLFSQIGEKTGCYHGGPFVSDDPQKIRDYAWHLLAVAHYREHQWERDLDEQEQLDQKFLREVETSDE